MHAVWETVSEHCQRGAHLKTVLIVPCSIERNNFYCFTGLERLNTHTSMCQNAHLCKYHASCAQMSGVNNDCYIHYYIQQQNNSIALEPFLSTTILAAKQWWTDDSSLEHWCHCQSTIVGGARAGWYEHKFISLYFLVDLWYALYISVFCIWIKQIKRMLPCRHTMCKKRLKSHYILTL